MALNAFANVFRIAELRARLAYTILLLAVYRLGIFINTPGIDRAAMNDYMTQQKQAGGLVNLLNLFSGGAIEQMSIFGLGIMPYVSASIVIQLLAVVVPKLEALQKEGAAGRQKLNQYTRYGTIFLSIIQGISISRWLATIGRSSDPQTQLGFSGVVVPNDGLWFTFMTVITLTAGTAFIMWLGERITERGIGNGISLIIFAGIVAAIPGATQQLYQLATTPGENRMGAVVALMLFMVFLVGVVVFVERGMRRIPVQYAKRMAGRRMFAGQATYFPLKVNMAGVIPPIFAGALLSFPATLGTFLPFLTSVQRVLESNIWIYNGVFVLLVVFFTFFYTALTFRPDDVADNIKKQGGYIPGIRPGRQTADYIQRVLQRITFGGAIYLAVICVIPTVVSGLLGQSFQFGGTALLIVVGVALDTVQQIEGHLISRNYEGFAGPRGPRIRGRVRAAA
ncbi:MAG: preprotein translocase subunit SecY [Myxococcaceae bacterium]|nr:preprotein translocase subunit SecY [Myxococcaceae bacterium]MCI0673355.1 preprotein translocase subunit SecY [Myxococcaceae bacterium]